MLGLQSDIISNTDSNRNFFSNNFDRNSDGDSNSSIGSM